MIGRYTTGLGRKKGQFWDVSQVLWASERWVGPRWQAGAQRGWGAEVVGGHPLQAPMKMVPGM